MFGKSTDEVGSGFPRNHQLKFLLEALALLCLQKAAFAGRYRLLMKGYFVLQSDTEHTQMSKSGLVQLLRFCLPG